MNQHISSVTRLPQVLLLSLCSATLAFQWGLYWYHQSASRQEALEAKAAEHLSLASITAANLQQLTERARVIATATYRAEDSLPNGRAISRILAEDPLLERMTFYDQSGHFSRSSHASEAQPLPEQWLLEVRAHASAYGAKPYLPRRLADQNDSTSSTWRLPFLLPIINSNTLELESILLVQLDTGYLANMFHNTDLGDSGMVRLLDGYENEQLRINNSGLVIEETRLTAGLPSDRDIGEVTHFGSGMAYQSLYSRVHDGGFSVVVSQQHKEVLKPHERSYWRQLLMNLGMTLLILGCMIWALRVFKKRDEAFRELEQAHRVNQELIDRLEEEQRRSTQAASTDHLSGLHNRLQFIDTCEKTLVDQRTMGCGLVAILFIDLDRFKSINDSLGHKVGDLLLQAVAGRISRALGPDDQAARFGGDEFLVLLAGERSEEQINAWVQDLVRKLSAGYSFDSLDVNTSASIGVSICPRDGYEVDCLIRCAEAAMNSAKRSGRGEYRFFAPSLNSSDINDFGLEQALVAALRERQFVLHFQPQMLLESMTVTGYEALVRWQHPQFGLLYPDRFISLAERSGFIVELGWEVIRIALDELERWQAQGRSSRLAVNVSAIQLRQEDFSDRLLCEMEKRGINAQRFELEVTETVVLDDEGLGIEHLQRLRKAGLSISLDDFGQGYAGFAHLQALPLSTLKIDRALIAPISKSYDVSPIVSSTINLAKRLGLVVVAEGVETREQLVYLELAGCDIAQGYYISRPMSAEQLYQYAPFNSMVEPAYVQ